MRHSICELAFAVIAALLLPLAGAAGGCASAPPTAAFVRHDAPPPSAGERYCAWFADRGGDTLYFGQAAFWAGYQATEGADPARDFEVPGPRPIGRFDLASEKLLPPLSADAAGARSGVWDVLVHPNGRVYFTTFFEAAGYVEPASARVRHFAEAGTGLAELSHGRSGEILATRYATAEGGGGSVVVLDTEGRILAEHPLGAAPGFQLAAKTAVLDPIRGDIWVNSDLLPAAGEGGVASARGPGGTWGAAGHPTLVLDGTGRERARIDGLEIQAMAFDRDGTGYFAVVDGPRLSIAIVTPQMREGDPRQFLEKAPRMVVDGDYPRALDFAQELDVDEAGRVILTRWSGHVHVLERKAPGDALSLRSLRLPTYEPGGLYYAAFLAEDRICATHCGRVSVVCGPSSVLAPGPATAR